MATSPFLDEDMKVVLTSCLLLFIPISAFLYNIDVPERYYFPFLEDGDPYWNLSLDPVIHGSKKFKWVISLGADRLCAIIYIMCAAIRPDFKRVLTIDLWWFYGIYEGLRLTDHFLTYEQTPFREYYGYFLIIFQMSYAILFIIRKK